MKKRSKMIKKNRRTKEESDNLSRTALLPNLSFYSQLFPFPKDTENLLICKNKIKLFI